MVYWPLLIFLCKYNFENNHHQITLPSVHPPPRLSIPFVSLGSFASSSCLMYMILLIFKKLWFTTEYKYLSFWDWLHSLTDCLHLHPFSYKWRSAILFHSRIKFQVHVSQIGLCIPLLIDACVGALSAQCYNKHWHKVLALSPLDK